MTDKLREFQRTHRSPRFPLLDLQAHLEKRGALDPEDVRDLSIRLQIPSATVRAAASYYSDLTGQPDKARVCHGTSCMLAGATQLHASVQSRIPCGTVYCLGYCDRSPAVLFPNGSVGIQCDPANPPLEPPPSPPQPSIRSIASRPIVTRRIINGDHSPIARAREAGVYDALAKALKQNPDVMIQTVTDSGERGRGGAGFPTGVKWQRCAKIAADKRYVIANGDEGDPGSFIDRVLMEMDPHAVLEGMAICARAVGSDEGIVFIRSEYPAAIERMRRAIEEAESAGFLGENILGSGFNFHVSIFPGMGSYVCGEETAMLNAVEGFRGEVRLRPPYPAESGLYGKPTIINNVETLVNIPWIVGEGADAYRALGTADSNGTKALCLNHGFAQPGILEIEFGVTLREVIEQHAGGGSNGKKLAGIILGGPMGSIVPPEQWDAPIGYAEMAARGLTLGHGGIVALPEGTDFHMLLIHWLRFMQHESCGKCVPCRVGSQRTLEIANQLTSESDEMLLRRLLDVMSHASLCAFGQLLPGPMRTLLDRYLRPDDRGAHI